MLCFSVPGAPVPWKASTIVRRPQTKRGFAGIKDARLESFQSLVALAASKAMAGQPPFPRSVPLSISVDVTLPIPPSWSQRKKDAAVMGNLRPTSRPDTSNLVKAIEDGCTSVVWEDDSSIVRIEASKVYGLVPGMTIMVAALTSVEGA
jgi:Holliday junction resolvase RusA-like endonuclease